MWARIENNIVMEITDIDPAERFHPSLIWVECPVDTRQGYFYSNNEFTSSSKDQVIRGLLS
ncbi:TPA: hypothetical protein HNC90_22490 [Escherichia coli]|nr:hypothetical protein [Escherichia coli]